MLVPKKSLGQNFLIDNNIIKKITDILKIKNKNIFEIGPGTGKLTDEIIKKKPKNLYLIEKDINLFLKLQKKYKNENNIKIFNYDALNYDYKNLKDSIIFSNLPYNISTKLIFKFLKDYNCFTDMIFLIQKEVADKMNYNKNLKMNKYKFFIEATSKFSIKFEVSNKVFYPKPKVSSCLIKINPKNNKLLDKNKLYTFSKKIFSQKRKKISNIIKFKKNLSNIQFLLNKRAEDLNTNQLLLLFNSF